MLNLTTGSISPQFHVVFDDTFSSVISLAAEESPPDFWNDIDLANHTHRVQLDNGTDPRLSPDWLTPAELEERDRHENHIRQIQADYPSFTSPKASSCDHPIPATPDLPAAPISTSLDTLITPSNAPSNAPHLPLPQSGPTDSHTPIHDNPMPSVSSPSPTDTSLTDSQPDPPSIRQTRSMTAKAASTMRQTRSMTSKGQKTNSLANTVWANLTTIEHLPTFQQQQQLAYNCFLETDLLRNMLLH